MEPDFPPLKEPERTAPPLELPQDLASRLQFTQSLRVQVMDGLTAGGTKIPDDDDKLKMVLEVARNMDATTLGEMRMQVEAASVGNEMLVAAAIRQMSGNRIVNQTREMPSAPPRVIPPSPELEFEVELVPDQTLIGQQSLNFDDFRERFGKK